MVIYTYDKAVKNRLGNRKNLKRKLRWQEKIRDVFDVPLEGLSKWNAIQIVGNCEVCITGCAGVLVYMPDRILLRGVSGNILVLGEQLEMNSLRGDRVTVCGKIDSVYPDWSSEEHAW